MPKINKNYVLSKINKAIKQSASEGKDGLMTSL